MVSNEFIEVSNQTGEKLKIEVSWEADIWAWAKVFRVILGWLEFPSITVERILPKGDSPSEAE